MFARGEGNRQPENRPACRQRLQKRAYFSEITDLRTRRREPTAGKPPRVPTAPAKACVFLGNHGFTHAEKGTDSRKTAPRADSACKSVRIFGELRKHAQGQNSSTDGDTQMFLAMPSCKNICKNMQKRLILSSKKHSTFAIPVI